MVGYTHSKRKKLRNRLCQYKNHQSEQLICQVSLALPAHIPVFTSISFSLIAVWKSCTEQRGAAWRSTQPAAGGSATSPPSDPTHVPRPGCYLQEEATKQRHSEVEVVRFISALCFGSWAGALPGLGFIWSSGNVEVAVVQTPFVSTVNSRAWGCVQPSYCTQPHVHLPYSVGQRCFNVFIQYIRGMSVGAVEVYW